MYIVIEEFYDLQDYTETKQGNIYRKYNVGDTFPRSGFDVDQDRIRELSSDQNRRGIPLIKEVQSPTTDAADTTEEAPKVKRTRRKKAEQ